MNVDVTTEIEIAAPRALVAEFAADPDNATKWYRNIKKIEWRSDKPLRVGSLIAFVAEFMGRSIAYTRDTLVTTSTPSLLLLTGDPASPLPGSLPPMPSPIS